MRYILFEIGPLTVYSYGFMIALGIIAAVFTADFRAFYLKLGRLLSIVTAL